MGGRERSAGPPARGLGAADPGGNEGEGPPFAPYVAAAESPAEATLKSILAGVVFGILFGAANAYLGLRAGLTISTSIPVAVMTVAVFRLLLPVTGRSTILEHNMAQTVGSASSSVASGVIFTLPALFLWGMSPSLVRMILLATCGGLLGVLFMIPLRRLLIEREHGRIPYPEGTACAQVLMASESGGARARSVFTGLGLGALMKFLTGWSRVVPDEVSVNLPFLPKGRVSGDISAALFGVGFILGPRVSAIMVAGGALSALVLIPAIAIWGRDRSVPLYPETILPIAEMSPGQLWTRYVRYIGAGAVATGGLITLIRSLPTMVDSFREGTRELRSRLGGPAGPAASILRTGRDLPLGFLGGGVVLVVVLLSIVPHLFGSVEHPAMRVLGSVLVAVFAFFFVTVSSRIVGLVGVTSNPTSGMTIASLIGTSAIFLMLGWTDDVGKVAALSVGCVVAVAASIAGDTSQDLKTGFLLGATPYRQQLGEVLGVLTSTTFVCVAVLLLDQAYGFGSSELPAPQATLMKVVIEGVLQKALPWILVGIGAGIALAVEAFRLPSLPFAVGVYLPMATMVPVFLGGLLRHWMERTARSRGEAEHRREEGILLGSGLVGGEGILGVGIAGFAAYAASRDREPWQVGHEWLGPFAPAVALVVMIALVGGVTALIRRRGGAEGGG